MGVRMSWCDVFRHLLGITTEVTRCWSGGGVILNFSRNELENLRFKKAHGSWQGLSCRLWSTFTLSTLFSVALRARSKTTCRFKKETLEDLFSS